MLYDDPGPRGVRWRVGEREALEEGDIYKLMAHSCGFMAEINTGL